MSFFKGIAKYPVHDEKTAVRWSSQQHTLSSITKNVLQSTAQYGH